MLSSENPEFLKELETFAHFVSPKKWRQDRSLNEFKVKKLSFKTKNFSLSRQFRVAVSDKEPFNQAIMNRFVNQAWRDPDSIEPFYQNFVRGFGPMINNPVTAMKSLKMLHYFISQGSLNTIDFGRVKSKTRHTLNVIFETVLMNKMEEHPSLVFRYAYLLYLKVNMHNNFLGFLEPNFAVHKTRFIDKYGALLSEKTLYRLLFYLRMLGALFVSERKYTFDYYFKAFITALFEEITSVMGVVSNVILYFEFVRALHPRLEGGMDEESRDRLDEIGSEVLDLLEQTVDNMNLYIVQCKKLGFVELIVFKKRKDLKSTFMELSRRMKRTVQEARWAGPSGFTKNYLNGLLKMNECLGIEDFSKGSSVVGNAKTFKKESLLILKKLASSHALFVEMKLDCLDQTHTAELWRDDNVQEMTSFREISYIRSTLRKTQGTSMTRTMEDVSKAEDKGKSRPQLGGVSLHHRLIEKTQGRQKGKTRARSRKKVVKRNKTTQTEALSDGELMAQIRGESEVEVMAEQPSEEDNRAVHQKIEALERLGIHEDVIKSKARGEWTPTRIEEGRLDHRRTSAGKIEMDGEDLETHLHGEFGKNIENWLLDYDDLVLEDTLASGSTCVVFKGRYRNLEVAIKRLNTPSATRKFRYLKEFKREMGLLISIPKHENLVGLYGFTIHEEQIYLVFEYCGGQTLFDLLYKSDTKVDLTFQQKVKVLMDVARGMQFLHSFDSQMIHRDLKTLNILIDIPIEGEGVHFVAKIADFGLTRTYEANAEFLTKRMGTFHWMAPEIYNKKPYSSKSDVYAYAIIMWEIFSERTPYYRLDSPQDVIQYVFHKGMRPDLSDCRIHRRYQNYICRLIKTNWGEEPEDRMEFKDIYRKLAGIYKDL